MFRAACTVAVATVASSAAWWNKLQQEREKFQKQKSALVQAETAIKKDLRTTVENHKSKLEVLQADHRKAVSEAKLNILQSPTPEVPSEMQEVYPFPHFPANPGLIKHVRKGSFIVGYDPFLRSPRWVIERITRESVTGPANRKGVRFFEDRSLPPNMRVGARAFRGYSRGHMASAGAHKDSQEALVSTFVMSQIIPQDFTNNASDWLRLELWTRGLAKEFGEIIVLNAVGYHIVPALHETGVLPPNTPPNALPISRPQVPQAKEGVMPIKMLNHKVWTSVPSLVLKAVCIPGGLRPPQSGGEGDVVSSVHAAAPPPPAVAFFVTRNCPEPASEKRIPMYQCSKEEFSAWTGIHNPFGLDDVTKPHSLIPESMMKTSSLPKHYEKIIRSADLQAKIATCPTSEACKGLLPMLQELEAEPWQKGRMNKQLKQRIQSML